MLMAMTREISAAFQACELTHVPRVPIDLDRARAQHAAYEWALVEAGCTVRRLDSGPDMPDAVFVEDIAVVLDEGAVVCRPGAASRRAETPGVTEALARHGRPLQPIQAPGILDGGDVLVIGRQVFVGSSARTNRAGIDQLARILAPVGYAVQAVPVRGCLHLKSAVTALAPDRVLINREWVPAEAFTGLSLVDIDPEEPYAANALAIGEVIVYPTSFPRTRERLERRGLRLRLVDVDEIQKAEGAVTCCSVIFEM
ncbi:MAG: dimethylargininase [Acidobacteria bacterium]|nr:dimethylargininase [Acidobacteriota bacterium]